MRAFRGHRVIFMCGVAFVGGLAGCPAALGPGNTPGQVYSLVLQWGSPGSDNGQFAGPTDLALDASGEVYVVDSEPNNRIQKFSSSGDFVTLWGSAGSGDGQFDGPRAAAVGRSGLIYVADNGNDRIQVFDPQGNYLWKWGTRGTAPGQFAHPHGVAVDAWGAVYVTDTDNSRIQVFTWRGSFLNQWPTTAMDPELHSHPWGIAADNWGNVYVAEHTNRHMVWKFRSNGSFVATIGSRGTEQPFSGLLGVAVDGAGCLYVADDGGVGNSRIQKFSATGCYLTSFGDGQLVGPSGVKVDKQGNAFVADSEGQNICKFAPEQAD